MKKFFSQFDMGVVPGVLLMLATVAALIMVNSPGQEAYLALKHAPVTFHVGSFLIDKPLLLWVNDGLMAIFFLLVGLEIKRELLEGHLSSRQQASLPAIAALGGFIFPALIFTFFNGADPVLSKGWAIPAATDIAFALGALLLLGKRVPLSLKVCLVAIAVIDDLMAIIVIAVFYSGALSLKALLLSLLGLGAAILLNRRGVTRLGPYMMLGLFIWACVLKSGVHATLAGVALGLIIPMKKKNREGKKPLEVLEHALHPWVSFLVMPIFAFMNAGVSFEGVTPQFFTQPLTLGIILGLFFGKQIGVMLFTRLGCSFGLCRLPAGVTWVQFYGMALLTGIGFTMSLFIGTLAFPSDLTLLTPVRLGVLTGSFLSLVAGAGMLLYATRIKKSPPV